MAFTLKLLQQRGQTGHDVRVLEPDIVGLGRVFVDVIQLPQWAARLACLALVLAAVGYSLARQPPTVTEPKLVPRQPAPDPAGPWKIAVYILATYALLMTGLAIYGLTRSTGPEPAPQPAPGAKKK